MNQSQITLKRLFQAFSPDRPLQPTDSVYVNCQGVRGDGDILKDLGKEISLENNFICRLYSGHRGAGKTTELLRLKKYLEDLDNEEEGKKNFYVVYFEATDDIDPIDSEYTDILLACTRRLLEKLREESVDPAAFQKVLTWLKDRWDALAALLNTRVDFDQLSIEQQISMFTKLTATLKAVPSTRNLIRQQVENYSESLVSALNELIRNAKKQLPDGRSEIVLIVDNLDRIPPVYYEDKKRWNYELIFIDRCDQLKDLECHLVYTVPNSMMYSDQHLILSERYGGPVKALPMIMVHEKDNEPYEMGINKLKELIGKRAKSVNLGLTLENVFQGGSEGELIRNLCLMSGGHVRDLVQLMRISLRQTEQLPITSFEVQRAKAEVRDAYRKAVLENEWDTLAEIYIFKEKQSDNNFNKLLFSRCILEYRSLKPDGGFVPWYDVHPLILEIESFQKALERRDAQAYQELLERLK